MTIFFNLKTKQNSKIIKESSKNGFVPNICCISNLLKSLDLLIDSLNKGLNMDILYQSMIRQNANNFAILHFYIFLF
ncbi:hypothetical protein BpHYR1_030650 [Brachionus plicatilis]|uniref:Uncharacterized protein n=1 Tax=Brachionus plicatilis TaxID=10195 RepID=A0A3M7Q945_BRAPC|nr:hypothetical protein BpHYR1_030650 [Brachionus plicatilis]